MNPPKVAYQTSRQNATLVNRSGKELGDNVLIYMLIGILCLVVLGFVWMLVRAARWQPPSE